MVGGARHTIREDTGRPAMTVQASRRLITLGLHENPLPLEGRVLGHMKFYKEQKRGGGGGWEEGQRKKKQEIKTFGARMIGGDAFFYLDAPPPPNYK